MDELVVRAGLIACPSIFPVSLACAGLLIRLIVEHTACYDEFFRLSENRLQHLRLNCDNLGKCLCFALTVMTQKASLLASKMTADYKSEV